MKNKNQMVFELFKVDENEKRKYKRKISENEKVYYKFLSEEGGWIKSEKFDNMAIAREHFFTSKFRKRPVYFDRDSES